MFRDPLYDDGILIRLELPGKHNFKGHGHRWDRANLDISLLIVLKSVYFNPKSNFVHGVDLLEICFNPLRSSFNFKSTTEKLFCFIRCFQLGNPDLDLKI